MAELLDMPYSVQKRKFCSMFYSVTYHVKLNFQIQCIFKLDSLVFFFHPRGLLFLSSAVNMFCHVLGIPIIEVSIIY